MIIFQQKRQQSTSLLYNESVTQVHAEVLVTEPPASSSQLWVTFSSAGI